MLARSVPIKSIDKEGVKFQETYNLNADRRGRSQDQISRVLGRYHSQTHAMNVEGLPWILGTNADRL